MEQSLTLCISVSEMAKRLGIGLTNAYKLTKDKSFFPALKIGSRTLISAKDLQVWLNQKENKGEQK